MLYLVAGNYKSVGRKLQQLKHLTGDRRSAARRNCPRDICMG
jgi:hypothetical protein